MYKKLEIELQSSTNTYLEDKVEVTCNFKLSDPSEIIKNYKHNPADPSVRIETSEQKPYGNYTVKVDFPKDASPSKEEILDAVNDLDGIVSTY